MEPFLVSNIMTQWYRQSDNALKRLWQVGAQQRSLFALAAGAMLLANMCLFVPPLLGKLAIDSLTLTSEASSNLWRYGFFSVLVTVLAGAFQFARGRCTALAAENVARKLRADLYENLHNNKATFFDNEKTGDLVQRCSSDVETVRVFLANNLVDITRSIILLLCATPVLFWVNPTLALISVCLMPLLVIGSTVFFAHAKRLFLAVDEAEGRLSSCLQENLTGIRVVRAFNRQKFEIDQFGKNNADFRDCNYRLMTSMSIFWALSDLVSFTQLGIVLIAGAIMVQNNTLSIGELFVFMTYVAMVIWPVRRLGRVLVDSGKSMVAIRRIDHILSQPAEPAGVRPTVDRASGALSIRGVSVSHNGNVATPALTNISLDIKAGETVALVGAPGSGKSTLMTTLLKLYAYQSGSITVDGHELSTLDRHWLRQQFAVVFQEPFLYSQTIAGNLRVGNDQADRTDMTKACNDAALHDSIMEFENQYEVLIGERGVTLSGGQRQRLALARALLRNAPFLLLDDALSAVDSKTEKIILNALSSRRGKQTTLIAAHRLSTIRQADRIVLLENGRIVQDGTHEELANTEGPYQRLCKIQQSLDASIDDELFGM